MSWQAYVDSSLVGTGNIDKAAIFNAEGTSTWAASPHLKHGETEKAQVSPAEIQEIVNAYADKGTPKKVQSEGFYVHGERYVTIKADERSLYGRKGKEGVVIVKTTLAILIGHYPATVQPGSAATTVEKLGDYLIGVGY